MNIAAACTVPEIDAAAPFYGTPRDEFADFGRTKTPVQGHFGNKDPIVAVARVEALAERAKAAGRRFDVCLYDAGHALMRSSDPHAYDAPSAALAWFLRETLAG